MRAVATVALIALTACASGGAYRAAPRPRATGAAAEMAAYGRELILHTRKHLRPYVTANMDCAACHVNAGTKARGGSFVGIAAEFPQWNKRAHRVIALQDRLAECFLYSMNGHPPSYYSREMLAMVAYITDLSRGIPMGSGPDPRYRLAQITPPKPVDIPSGAHLYAQKCIHCHGAGGAGNNTYPPLWGQRSFNAGAGMHRLETMASFIRYNMPRNAPGTLTDQQSFDIAAFVLRHKRPTFQGARQVTFPGEPARYF
ncbi:MAG TPA: c-type cytochrome [Candidatus Baltobacteraceae bacterium]|nr:c-type cytochrome [Candidatus Baltobacteraceae bacterium]